MQGGAAQEDGGRRLFLCNHGKGAAFPKNASGIGPFLAAPHLPTASPTPMQSAIEPVGYGAIPPSTICHITKIPRFKEDADKECY